MNISRRRALGLIAASATVPLAASCGETPKERVPVTLMLDWVPNTNHTGIYVARDFGFYTDNGLDVTIVEPGTAGAAAAVASGAAHFGVSYQEEVTLARVQDVPLVSVAAIIQHNTSGFASPVDRKIRTPRDFAGKKYGAFGYGFERPVLSALMQCDGGDAHAVEQIEFVDIGTTDMFVAWERGDVDFTWIFEAWDGIRAQQAGVELNYARLTDLDCIPDYYTPVLVTSEAMIATHPDIVQRFVRATALGYQLAINEPSRAAEALIKAVDGIDADLARESQAWLSPRYAEGAGRWGEQKRETWSAYATWLVDRGLLEHAINPNNAFDNSFIDNA